MSLINKASLIMTPNAVKEGKIYSIIPQNGNGDMTFSRATTATKVNSEGFIEDTPYNLLSYSEEFSNAFWNNTELNVSGTPAYINQGIAPNGTMTADKIIPNTVNGVHRFILQAIVSNININSVYTLSIYIKKNDFNFFFFRENINGTVDNSFFNLATVSLGTIASGRTATIQDVGSGWIRCSVTATTTTSSISTIGFGVCYTNGTTVIIGNNTKFNLIWGAQLVQGSVTKDYVQTTNRLNVPRLNYDVAGGCPSILLEPQRTNLSLRSEEFDDNYWAKSNVTITPNVATSPNNSLTADLVSSTTVGSFPRYIVNAISGTIGTIGTTYTLSVYAKKNTSNFIQIAGSSALFTSNVWCNFDINSGTIGSFGTDVIGKTITYIKDGWYRCTMTAVATSNANNSCLVIALIPSSTAIRIELTTNITLSTYIWAAQIEVGPYPTSYIPTIASAVTRVSDSLSRNNIYTNGLITSAGGTWFVELNNNISYVRDIFNFSIALNTATNVSGYGFAIRTGAGSSRLVLDKVTGVGSVSLYGTSTNTIKVVFKWNGTTVDIFVNGIKVVSGTSFTATAMEFLTANGADVPKYIKSMMLFPAPLTDNECTQLTTL